MESIDPRINRQRHGTEMTDEISQPPTTAFITGAATGLGRELALQYSRRGVAVGVGYSSSDTEAIETVGSIQREGGIAIAVYCDVTVAASVLSAVNTVVAQLGPVDVLINNAGTTRRVAIEDFETADDELWGRVMDVNLMGAVRTIREVLPAMRESKRGSILNIASNSVFTADGSSLPYVVSKSALVSLTRSLAKALAPTISVNALAPGWMPTAWLDRHGSNQIVDDNHPLIPVTDVAAAAWSLTSNPSITGHVLVTDRGESLGLTERGSK